MIVIFYNLMLILLSAVKFGKWIIMILNANACLFGWNSPSKQYAMASSADLATLDQ